MDIFITFKRLNHNHKHKGGSCQAEGQLAAFVSCKRDLALKHNDLQAFKTRAQQRPHLCQTAGASAKKH